MWSCYFWCETDLISNLKFVELHRRFDDSFKIMAVDLSVVRGSVAEVAKELDIGPSLLSKRCRNPHYNEDKVFPDNPKISTGEQELRILRKKLRDAELECDILKKVIAIFSRGDDTYTDS